MKDRAPRNGRGGGKGSKSSVQDGSDLPASPAFNQQVVRLPRKDPRRGRMWWYQIDIKAEDSNTQAMSAAGVGCYFKLCSRYIRNLGPLDDDDRMLARFCGVNGKEWSELRYELLDVFEIVDGKWLHAGLDDQIAKFKRKSDTNRGNGRGRDQDSDDDRLEDVS